jgi:type III restriction enzyme
METYWVPGVNHLGSYGRWAFAELTDLHGMEADFAAAVGAASGPADTRSGWGGA